jgi:SAM-dependent methyltransferase
MNAMRTKRELPACGARSIPALDAVAAELLAQARLAPGARVLDACCGSGAAALAAAEAVGPFGCAVALGCDEQVSAGSRAEALRLGLGNVSFLPGGLESLDELPETFDAVICACASWDHPEMLIRQLWHWLRVDGQLIIASVEAGVEPGHSAFAAALADRGSIAAAEFSNRAGLAKLLAMTDGEPRTVDVQATELGFGSVEDWWTDILAPTYHASLSTLEGDKTAQVRAATLRNLAGKSWQKARLNILSGIAWKRKSSALPA